MPKRAVMTPLNSCLWHDANDPERVPKSRPTTGFDNADQFETAVQVDLREIVMARLELAPSS